MEANEFLLQSKESDLKKNHRCDYDIWTGDSEKTYSLEIKQNKNLLDQVVITAVAKNPEHSTELISISEQ